MRTVRRALLLLLLAAAAAPVAARAADPPPLPSRAQLLADRANFLQLAEQGLKKTKQLWWNEKLGWYDDRLNDIDRLPLATLWSAYPLFEATNAVAIAHPTAANKAAVNFFARKAEKYWDPNIKPFGGFSYYYTARGGWNAYFDDNGWWGLAFLDAYRATGNKRWLWNAGRALKVIDGVGWDKKSGGVWWDTDHHHKTSEPLAAGALIAAMLYRYEPRPYYLKTAKKYIAWADKRTWVKKVGLYGRNPTDTTVMDYVEGMFIAAHAELCEATKVRSYCTKAKALANARDEQGLWSKRWDGDWTKPGMLRTQAGTLALLGWIAAAKPPSVLTWK